MRRRADRIPTWARAPVVVAAGAFFVALVLAGLFAPLPHDPLGTDPLSANHAPNGGHWFGTDSAGADVFSRVVRAGATELPIAFGAAAVSLLLGVAFALLVSVKSRGADAAMRGLDAFQALPSLILVLAMVQFGGGHVWMVIVAIAVIAVPNYIRVLRSELLSLRERKFVKAARASGAGELRILRVHLLPNLAQLIVVQTSLTLSLSILAVAALSFVGLGIHPPTPSWGGMIRDGAAGITAGYWWMVVFPGIAILLCVLLANAVADAINGRLRGISR